MNQARLCPSCQRIYTGDSQFCPKDGARLGEGATILAGKFVLGKELGRGGMGVVFEAQQPAMNRRVAVKLLAPELCRNAAMVERFEREALAVGRLRHEHIITVYDCGQDAGQVYLAMEFLEGEGLGQRLAQRGRLPLEEALRLWRQAVAGVAAAHHGGIVHRDLKPDNLFIDHEKIKILDFGIARILAGQPAAHGTAVGAVIGTPMYMAPEQLDGLAATFAADVYALGLILCEMLTGRLPFGAHSGNLAAMPHLMRLTQPPLPLRKLCPDVPFPDALQRLLDDALAFDPARRPPDAAVLLSRLDEIDKASKLRPRPWRAALAAAAALTAIGVVAFMPVLRRPASTPLIISPSQPQDLRSPVELRAAAPDLGEPARPALPPPQLPPRRAPLQKTNEVKLTFVIARPSDRLVTITCTGGAKCAEHGGTCVVKVRPGPSCTCNVEAVAYEHRSYPCASARVELRAKPF